MILSKNRKITSGALRVLTTGLSISYPFIFYFYGPDFPILWFMGILFSLMILQSLNTYWNEQGKWSFLETNVLIFVGIVGTALIGINSWDSQMTPFLYPVITSLALGFIFAKSLFFPPSLIERLARLREPNLDATGVAYTRKVTIAWVVFCCLNALISGATALWADVYLWTLYNGFISYCLMGILMGIEYAIRCLVRLPKLNEEAQ